MYSILFRQPEHSNQWWNNMEGISWGEKYQKMQCPAKQEKQVLQPLD